jgi:hypothetical protein
MLCHCQHCRNDHPERCLGWRSGEYRLYVDEHGELVARLAETARLVADR